MSSVCLGCAAGHGDGARECASCGEVATPRGWLNPTGDNWDALCDKCVLVVVKSSRAGLEMAAVISEGFQSE